MPNGAFGRIEQAAMAKPVSHYCELHNKQLSFADPNEKTRILNAKPIRINNVEYKTSYTQRQER